VLLLCCSCAALLVSLSSITAEYQILNRVRFIVLVIGIQNYEVNLEMLSETIVLKILKLY